MYREITERGEEANMRRGAGIIYHLLLLLLLQMLLHLDEPLLGRGGVCDDLYRLGL